MAAEIPLQALWEPAMAGKGQSSLSCSGFSWEHPAKDLGPSWGRLQGTKKSLPWVLSAVRAVGCRSYPLQPDAFCMTMTLVPCATCQLWDCSSQQCLVLVSSRI